MSKALYKNPYETIKVPRFEESEGFYTTKKRSRNMSKIRAKDSKPELVFRKALWKQNIRYRTHVKTLPGTPDLAITKYKLAIFVDGIFWHGYQWDKRKNQIKTNRNFWIPKIERNMQRDRENREALESKGYTVMRFWEHEIKQSLQACINQVELYIETAKSVKIPVSLG
ncbi:very short patch repair endonuclease [Pedobacter arcticus]|uniref:very short patch repair endonuclease n=1 Tax=Pedobacter arcticus TaxID=752140 RepID=UPI000362C55D|nr:very short patch repair endonuclease [Pedobacter arcticus]